MWFGFGKPDIEKLEMNRNVKGLKKALRNKEPEIRRNAATALGDIGDLSAVDALVKALFDIDDYVCSCAAYALENLNWKPTDGKLIVRYGLLKRDPALSSLIDESSLRYLVEELDDKAYPIRVWAAITLGSRKDISATRRLIEVLTEGLNDLDNSICEKAADSLDKLGWKPDNDESSASYWIARGNWGRCAELGGLAVNPLITALENCCETTRKNAAETLGIIGDPRAIAPLSKAIKIRPYERWVYAKALSCITHPDVVEPLIHLMEDNSWEIRRNAASTLVKLYHDGCIDEAGKKRILSVRDKIIGHHYDGTGYKRAVIGASSDCEVHTDSGVGVDFPI